MIMPVIFQLYLFPDDGNTTEKSYEMRCIPDTDSIHKILL